MEYTIAMFLLVMWGVVCVLGQAPTRPHIIVLLADDFGWANIGYHNNSQNINEVVTPTLNSLHSVGIELDRHYVYKYCSPSRCSFLSGRNPIHVNAFNQELNYNSANNISGYAGVPLNMTLISSKLKQAGYATHYTGKWDAGFATQQHLPVSRGFDTGFGYLQHTNDYWQYTTGGCSTPIYDIWNNTAPAYNDTNPSFCSQIDQTGCAYEDDMFVEHVLQELDDHNTSQPLFYYYAMHNVHAPLEVPQKYIDRFSFIDDSQRQRYAAMVNHMDDTIALVIAKIKAKGMWNNTLILFSSDNGGPVYAGGGANNFPLKGGKMTNYEGGIRVNAFLSGGYIPTSKQGTKSEDFITIADWYATFCALAGVSPVDTSAALANLPPVDSYNLWPLFSGTNNTNPRTEIPIGTNNGGNGNNVEVQGIIIPPYKLLLNALPTSFWQGPLYPNTSTNYNFQSTLSTQCGAIGCLYNIVKDPNEHRDIHARHPNITARLYAMINYYQGTVFDPYRGPVDPTACVVAGNVYNGFFGPWVVPS